MKTTTRSQTLHTNSCSRNVSPSCPSNVAADNPKQIAARAGHTSVSVVLDRYGHLYPDHDISLIDTLEAHAQRAAMR